MRFYRKLPGFFAGLCIALGCQNALPDDIDIFTGLSAGAGESVNVLVILDNTANWSRQAQHWPDGGVQGASEALAIKTVINTLNSSSLVNVGLEMLNDDSSGYIRYNINPMSNATNRSNFSAILDTISAGTNSPSEKVSQSTPWGNLWWDAYNYLGGLGVSTGGPTPNFGDSSAYSTLWSRFRSPLDSADSCARTVIIFIGNSGPASAAGRADSAANGTALTGLGGTISPELQVPLFTTGTAAVTTNLGYSAACYSASSSCATTGFSACVGTPNTTYDSCACNAGDSTSSLDACSSGLRYDVTATGGSTSSVTTTTSTTNNGTSGCYTGSGGCTTGVSGGTETGGLSCPANTDTGAGSNPRIVSTYSCSYACGTTGGGSCPSGPGTPTSSNSTGSAATSTAASTACYTNGASCTSAIDQGGMSCAATTGPSPATCSSYPCTQITTTHACSYACGSSAGAVCTAAASGSVSVTACSTQKGTTSASVTACTDSNSTTPSGCDTATPKCPPNALHTYTCPGTTAVSSSQTFNGVTCGGNGSNRTWPITRTANYTDPGTNKFTVTKTDTPTTTTKTTPGVANFTYGVVQTVTRTTTTTTASAASNVLGNTFACYASLGVCSASDYTSQCSASGTTCACTGTGTTTGNCPNGTLRYQVQGSSNQTSVVPTGTYGAGTAGVYLDEWAKFLHQTGVNAPTASGGTALRSVTTYTIDVFHDQQDAATTSLLLNAANVGGGKYFSATNLSQLVAALKAIFAEIQSVNSAFASASLPVSATARTQDKNQVFIGMFRPDPQARPLWFGNVKQYKVVKNATTGQIELGDSTGATAINTQTGFITDCAKSYWTTDETPPYWSNVASDPPARGACATATNKFSDSPDGPMVEKGASAEVIRKGNNPPTTNATPTYALNRTIKTLTNAATPSLVDFTVANTGLATSLLDFIAGKDTEDEDNDGNLTETRPSLHGDVVHSRPLAIDYGGAAGVIVYYGANDGMIHATNATTGKELWAFVAPEFYTSSGTSTVSSTRFQRLKDNSPQINYPNLDPSTTPTPTPKDYYFDGLIGAYQKADNSKIWIYPAMRRGGRMVYAFDVSPVSGAAPTAPIFKWRFGCPNLSNDTGCSTGGTGIGQTWSFPNVAFIKGYSTTTPVVIVGGGYSTCEDANSIAPSCTGAKGSAVYILDGNDGTLLRSFATDRSVVADIGFVDVDLDGAVDYGYVADTGGNVYRIDFLDGPISKGALIKTDWAMHKVAYTTGGYRKFLFKPAMFQASASIVYVGLGSGDREHPLSNQYPYTNPVTNRFYMFKDDLTKFTASDSTSTPFSLDSSSLMADETTKNACGDKETILPSSAKKGWFLSLNANGTGEQVVTSALIEAGFVDFSTNRPIPPATASCSTPLGEARGYKLNLLNGSGVIGVSGLCGGDRSTTFAGGGLPPSPVLATVPLDDGTMVTVAIGTVSKNSDCIPSPLSPCKVTLPIGSKRRPVYWMKSTGEQ